MQQPPEYSALKIKGQRAYDLARAGRSRAAGPARGADRPYRACSVRMAASGARDRLFERERTSARLRATWARRSAAAAMSEELVRTRIGPFTLETCGRACRTFRQIRSQAICGRRSRRLPT